jgi:hypothetical protein
MPRIGIGRIGLYAAKQGRIPEDFRQYPQAGHKSTKYKAAAVNDDDRRREGAQAKNRWKGGHPVRKSLLSGAASAAIVTAAALAFSAAPAGARTSAATASRSGGTAADTARCPWLNTHLSVAQRVALVLSRMTLPDEITMVEGQGTSQPYVFYIAAQPQLCIPAMGLEDGPVGVGDGLTGVTELPSAVSLAATFDPSLAKRYGAVVGAEEAGKGASANLGPTVNIDRDPRWGRSFETYTEDPFLNRSIAVSDIEGVQSQRVLDQVKHYAVYNQETNRNTLLDDVLISSRALHEIYLPTFQAAVCSRPRRPR